MLLKMVFLQRKFTKVSKKVGGSFSFIQNSEPIDDRPHAPPTAAARTRLSGERSVCGFMFNVTGNIGGAQPFV